FTRPRGEVAVLEPAVYVYRQVQVPVQVTVDVRAEPELVVRLGAVDHDPIFRNRFGREAVTDVLAAAGDRRVGHDLPGEVLHGYVVPVGIRIEPGIGAPAVVFDLLLRVARRVAARDVDLVE